MITLAVERVADGRNVEIGVGFSAPKIDLQDEKELRRYVCPDFLLRFSFGFRPLCLLRFNAVL